VSAPGNWRGRQRRCSRTCMGCNVWSLCRDRTQSRGCGLLFARTAGCHRGERGAAVIARYHLLARRLQAELESLEREEDGEMRRSNESSSQFSPACSRAAQYTFSLRWNFLALSSSRRGRMAAILPARFARRSRPTVPVNRRPRSWAARRALLSSRRTQSACNSSARTNTSASPLSRSVRR